MDTLPHENVILVRMGEITLKGLNRGRFEDRLIANLRRRVDEHGSYKIRKTHARILVEGGKEQPLPDDCDDLLQSITSVFGIVSASPARAFRGDLETIEAKAIECMRELLQEGKEATFKVQTRRGDKTFPHASPQVNGHLGARLLETFPDQLRVDVHEPQIVLHVEIRDRIYLYHRVVQGRKGLPVGMSGRGMLLLSGGIDSPVAGYLMASRGMQLEAIYFHAFPYTSDRAKEKVIELARQLTLYCGRLRLHVVDFTKIQVALRDAVPAALLTVIIRRMMMRIADALAEKRHFQALITGESLGQVASQTIEAITCTQPAAHKPVLRPLIGLDKDETIRLARTIGTYETSILPYEDCCTIFVAKHPKTKPTLSEIEAAEAELDLDAMTQQGLARIEEVVL